MANQTATIQLSLKQVAVLQPDGTRQLQNYPTLVMCPVITLFGGVDFLSLPIKPGDNCVVLFNDRELDNWLYSGDGQAPTTPRLHDLSDGIAIVGIRSLTNSIASYLANGIRLSHNHENSKIDLTDNLIDTIATLFLHHGNMEITQNLTVDQNAEVKQNLTVDENAEVKGNVVIDGSLTIKGHIHGNAGVINLDDALIDSQSITGASLHAGNGATGTFNTVTVTDGIVTGGS